MYRLKEVAHLPLRLVRFVRGKELKGQDILSQRQRRHKDRRKAGARSKNQRWCNDFKGWKIIKRGATLPLTVLPSITRNKLLMKAFEKHSRFNNNLVNGEVSQYRLMYPTGNQVLNLPGTEELFSLQRYKEEIDKPYSRITLFLFFN